ncbi:MAG: hypothetical protein HND48_00925 [Chloroflexi bacterium]|nr:hypothetical protein [Chloroflexota bacterium]
MIPALADFLHRRFGVPRAQAVKRLTAAAVIAVAIALVAVSTVIIAFDSILSGRRSRAA